MVAVENLAAGAVSAYSASSMMDRKSCSGMSDSRLNSVESIGVKVSLSASNGRALLMTRVFHASADANPPVESIDTAYGVTANYLRLDDREKMANLYDFASSHGIDLAHVDALSFDLAIYRRSLENSTPGPIYDPEGHRVTYAFSERESKEADHILSGDAINSTYLDRGFIHKLLNPVEMCSHATDFKFLEKALEVLSPSGDAGNVSASSGPGGFQLSQKWAPGDGVIENKSEDIQFDNKTQSVVGQMSGESRRDLIKRLANDFLNSIGQNISTYDALMNKHQFSREGSSNRSTREEQEGSWREARSMLSLSNVGPTYSLKGKK